MELLAALSRLLQHDDVRATLCQAASAVDVVDTFKSRGN